MNRRERGRGVAGSAPYPAGDDLGGSGPLGATDTRDEERAAQAQQVAMAALELRRCREKALGGRFLAEPAWDMLLDLYVRQNDGLRTTIAGVCAASAVPATTALRHLGSLIDQGLVELQSAPENGGMQFASLSRDAFDKLTALLISKTATAI